MAPHSPTSGRMHDPHTDYADPPRRPSGLRLSLWDSICLIVGIIIGASIYETSPSIFKSSGGAAMGMAAWALGGVVRSSGAFAMRNWQARTAPPAGTTRT